jgi:hypothetical protein
MGNVCLPGGASSLSSVGGELSDVDVKAHQDSETSAAGASRYDVSLKVGETIYVVLYTPPFGIDTVKYKPDTTSWWRSERVQLHTTTCWVGR